MTIYDRILELPVKYCTCTFVFVLKPAYPEAPEIFSAICNAKSFRPWAQAK